MSTTNKLVPLGKLLNVIETAGFKVEYQYDDLVFIDNTSMMFRFGLDDFETVYLHFNKGCNTQAKKKFGSLLPEIARNEKLKLEVASDFQLIQKEGTEELQITF